MAKNEVYYFSGTGNSLHVARELQKRIPGTKLIPIMKHLKKGVKSRSETVGIIFPIHALSLPWTVEEFLQKADFKSASYIYTISTRECFATVFSDMDKILKKQGKRLDAYFSIKMPQSYIPLFELCSQEEFRELESGMLGVLDSIKETISYRKPLRTKDQKRWFLLSHIIYPIIGFWLHKVRFPDMEKSFYADTKCIGCGTCEKICLSRKIKLVGGKPEWQRNVRCTYCFACLHYCPVQAVQIKGRKTDKKGRYHHPGIGPKGIIEQKASFPVFRK